MRVFGVVLWVIALLCLIVAFGMDTSVPTEAGGRVHNIGLMRTQENALLLGIGLFITGAIFIAFGGRKKRAPATASNKADTKSCPRCKEVIKSDALICRFCKLEFPFIDATVRDHLLRIRSLVADGLSNDAIAARLNSQGIKCLSNEGVWNADLVGNIRSEFVLEQP